MGARRMLGVSREPLSEGAEEFARQERELITANRAKRNAPPRVLSAEERAAIAAENAAYVPPTKRVPGHGKPGWSAMAPIPRGR